MSATRRTRAEMQQQTRRRILDAAYTVCSARGIHGASIEAIAAEAGFTKGAVYSNFENREDLLLALFADAVESYASGLVDALAARDDRDVPAVVGEYIARAAKRDRAHFVLMTEFWSYAARDPKVRRRFAAARRKYRALLTEIVESEAKAYGIELPVPASDLAAALLALSFGLVLERLVDPGVDPARAYESVLRMIYRGALA